jgi:hypothetical protein
VKTDTLQICFEGKIRGGYGICIDNIAAEAFYNNVGITDFNLDSKIRVYPNPTTGKLRIEIAGQARNDAATIEVFDIYGRKQKIVNRISEIGKSDIEIDISQLPAGIYVIKLEEKIVKIVKEKF